MIALTTNLAAVALAALLQGTNAAPAEPLEAGKALYWEARFPEAIDTLRTVIQGLNVADLDAAHRLRLADAYLFLGLAYYAIGQRDIARDAFKNVLSLNPGEKLDPEIYAPKLIEFFEQARLLAVAMEPASRDSAEAGGRVRREVRFLAPKFAVELWGGLDRFPDTTAPSQGYLNRLKAGGLDLSPVTIGGGRGQFAGIRFSLRLGDGRDRVSLGFEPFIRTGSPSHTGSLGEDYYGRNFDFDHGWDLNVGEWRLTWSRQVVASETWTLSTELAYRNAWLSHETYNLLTPTTAAAKSAWYSNGSLGGNNVDTVSITLHGLRGGLAVARRLGRRLSVDASLGYTLALRNQEVDPPDATAVTGYEFNSLFDLIVGARVDVGPWLDVALQYRLQNYGWTHLGQLKSSSYVASLTFHSSR
jgi:tetratricopeptide (TPR) repeat protein